MGERTNNIITKEFTYDVTDAWLSQSNDEGKTGTLTYEGPDKLWVFADKETGIVDLSPEYTEQTDGDLIPTPDDKIKVFIDANVHTLEAYIVLGHVNPDAITYTEETLPNGQIHREPETLLPHMVYNIDQMTYNPDVDWDDVRNARNTLLNNTDFVLINKILTEDERATLEAYRQELRDITTDFDGYPAWKVAFPETPNIGGLE
jgi:hypothetical protein